MIAAMIAQGLPRHHKNPRGLLRGLAVFCGVLRAVLASFLIVVGTVVVCIAVGAPALAQKAQKRVALVIGNSEYKHLPRLKNPTNDVREVADTLRSAQFEVIAGDNLSRIEFEELLKTFLRSVEGADVSLVYYSGHGIQIGGKNYLVPVDAKLTTPYDVEIESVNVDNIYGYLRENSRMQLVFLDACRDNPFRADQYWVADRLEKAPKSTGLAPPSNLAAAARKADGMGSLFAFSTEPDRVAYDGGGDLSHYTQAFVRRALTPNLEVRQMLTQVRRDVITSTNGKQIPWENSSLVADFFMVKLPSAPISTPIHRVNAVAGGRAAPLDFPAPRSPSGAPLTITFDRAPEMGRLLLGREPVTPDRKLQVADLTHLTYDPRGVPAGHVELITYKVTDTWKQSAQGALAIAVGDESLVARSSARKAEAAKSEVAKSEVAKAEAGNTSPVLRETKPGKPPVKVASVPVVQHREAHAYITALARQKPEITIGTGSMSANLPALGGIADPDKLTVTFTEMPGTGAVFANGKRIEAGTALPLADMPALSFEPQIGTQGQNAILRFALDTGEQRSAGSLTLKPTLDACDAEAAEPFDLQGVAPGRLPNEINPAPALRACELAIKRHPALARFVHQLGRAQLAARQVELGWKTFEKAVEQGHVRSLYQLGYLYRLGVGRPASQTEAVDFFRRGADKSDPYGIYEYGKALFYGRGIEKDAATGLRLMLRAADMGHTYAMNELGYIFIEGIGVAQDAERGMRFYRSGVERKDIYSLNNVGLAYLNGKGVERDLKTAARYFRTAADGAHPYAPTNLGRLYRDGAGVPRNVAQAVKLFETAAERGDYWGALERASLATEGSGRLRNAGDTAYYLALAAAINRPGTGDPDNRARKQLGEIAMPAKREAEQRLLRQLGEIAAATGDDASPDDRLIRLAHAAWEKRNPRIDLF